MLPLVSDASWRSNAYAISKIYDANRDNHDFAQKFTEYVLYLSKKQIEQRDNDDRRNLVAFSIVVYLDTKLLYQFILDHKDEFTDEDELAYRKAVNAIRATMDSDRIPFEFVAKSLDPFRRSFDPNNPILRLRSL